MDTYKIPYLKFSSLNLKMYLLYILTAIICFAGSIIFGFSMIKVDYLISILLSTFIFFLGALSLYLVIYVGVLKKVNIEITNNYLKISSIFKTYIANWSEIDDVQLYQNNNNVFLGVTLKKDKSRKEKNSFYNNLDSNFGGVPNSYSISLQLFQDLDYIKLYKTIKEQIAMYSNFEEQLSQISFKNEQNSNIIKASVFSILLTLLLGIIYGFSIYIIKTNYIVLPIAFTVIIISMFNTFYFETSIRIKSRIFFRSYMFSSCVYRSDIIFSVFFKNYCNN